MPSTKRFFRFAVEALECRLTPTGSPFTQLTTQYITSLPRGGNSAYDYQPTVLHDPSDTLDLNSNGIPDRLYKMWWSGRYMPPDVDLAPSDLDTDDRIYHRYSENGVNWSAPQVVLKGSGGTNGAIDGDDHLVGSPSVMKVGNTYYMFYESMANWLTPLNHFNSAAKKDAWVTNTWVQYQQSNGFLNGPNANVATPDYDSSYVPRNGGKSDILGWAPQLRKAGTHPIYGMETTYYLPNGPKTNRQLTLNPPQDWTTPQNGEIRRSLNDEYINGQFVPQPLFWLYDDYAPGRVPVYQFWVPGTGQNPIFDTVASNDPNAVDVSGAVLPASNLIGYAIAKNQLAGPDAIGSMQNRVMMAKSTDGVNWVRFQGPARGGAVITPQYELSAWRGYDVTKAMSGQYPHDACLIDPNGPDVPSNWTQRRWNLNEFGYGSGQPAALERDGFLELYFKDTVTDYPLTACRVRIPIGQIESPAAWAAARAPGNPSLTQFAPYAEDIKWSPTYRRYFLAHVNVNTLKPNVVYSPFDPDPNYPPTFIYPLPSSPLLSQQAGSLGDLPTGTGRKSDWGGILSDGLGHIVDSLPGGMARIDFVYSAYSNGFDYFAMDLDISRITFMPELAEARGLVFDDLNGNSVRDLGEPPFPGVAVFRDANNDGAMNAGETWTTTDANGNYVFAGLPPAYSTLRVAPLLVNSSVWPSRTVANTAGEVFLGQDFALRSVAPPQVSQVVVNGGATQRSRVTGMSITFTEPVVLPPDPANAFVLRRNSDQQAVNVSVTVSGSTVHLAFVGGAVDHGSLADGRYTLTVLAGSVAGEGGNLDGDFNGLSGGDYVLVGSPTTAPKLFRLFGDQDGNGRVDAVDFLAFRNAFLTNSPMFDFDGNGTVDADDFLRFRVRFLQSV
ncbi:MAG: hypothetical protein K1X57_07090 [Gemmataceae bacterium]|nr:hypothetical protein [Gemmataceae bacterium]